MQQQYNNGGQPRQMNPNQFGNGGYQGGYGQNYAQGFNQAYQQQQQQYNYQNAAYGNNGGYGNQGYQQQGFRNFNQRKPPFQPRKNFKQKKPKVTNIQENLKKFSAVQQVALLAPDAVIDVQPALPDKNCALWKGVATFRGVTIEAYQVGKKKTRQAVCSKVIKQFKLLDSVFHPGASEQLNIGMHTEEMPEDKAKLIQAQSAKQAANTAANPTGNTTDKVETPFHIDNMSEEQLLSEHSFSENNPKPSQNPTPQFESHVPPLPGTTPAGPKPPGTKPIRTPISVLGHKYPKDQKPKYEFLPTEGINSGFEVICRLTNGREFRGIGRGKKTAQHHAAHIAIQALFPAELVGLGLPEGAGTKQHPNNAQGGLYK